jgi:hypothetical protein
MLDNELKLIIEAIIEKAEYWGGGFKMTSTPSGKMITSKKPVIWKSQLKNPEKEKAQAASVAAKNKLIAKVLSRQVAKQKKAKVIQFPKRTPITRTEPRRKVLAAGLDLSAYLDYILTDNVEYSNEMRLSTARDRELQKMKKITSLQRSKERQKELRKQKAIASIQR